MFLEFQAFEEGLKSQNSSTQNLKKQMVFHGFWGFGFSRELPEPRQLHQKP